MKLPRLVIAGTKSGVGKSSIATGIMQALAEQGFKVQGFKVGPDYIDPGFHSLACGRPSRNLDLFLLGEEKVREIFVSHARKADISIIEGVMGLFDGSQDAGNPASTAALAKALHAPVILVVDCRSMAQSIAPLVRGFMEYDEQVKIAGVILNQVGSSNHERILKDALQVLSIPVVGVLPQGSLPALPKDGTGLSPQTTTWREKEQVKELGEFISRQFDLQLLCKLAETAPPVSLVKATIFPDDLNNLFAGIRIGYALDEAFCFYYQDTLDYLGHLGVELVPFSPLNHQKLPERLAGLVLGGGFLEAYLEALSANYLLRGEICTLALEGKPIYAEGAGFEYLTQEFIDAHGQKFPLTGLIPGKAMREQKLTALGYYTGQIRVNSILGTKGIPVKGHQHRRTVMEGIPQDMRAMEVKKRGVLPHLLGYCRGAIFASHLYQHWLGQPELAVNFVKACAGTLTHQIVQGLF